MPYTADPYDDTKPTGATLALYLDEEIRAAKGVLKDHRTRIVAVETTVATETVTGRVELASAAETVAGTDAERAVTSAGVAAALAARIQPVAAFVVSATTGAATKTSDLAGNVAISGYVRDIYANTLTFDAAFSGLAEDLQNSPRNFVLVGTCTPGHGVVVIAVNSVTSLKCRSWYFPDAADYATFEFSCVLYAAPIAP